MTIKNLVVVGNCYSHEIKRLLLSNKWLKENYNINVFFNYLGSPSEEYIKSLQEADFVICQNVKNIKYYVPSFVSENICSDATLYKFEFFRFNGFWPISSATARLSDWFWYPTDEFGDDLQYDDYIGMEIDRSIIVENFESQMEALLKIDHDMDYQPYNYFSKILHSTPTYSDHWHPTPVMFFPLAREVLLRLGSPDDYLDCDAESLININRRRLIFKSVGDELGLEYNYLEKFKFFDQNLSPEEYYYFSKFLTSNEFLSGLQGMNDLHNKLKMFLGL